MKITTSRHFSLAILATAALTACGGGSEDSAACAETGTTSNYACKTGSTEPLFDYQWGLDHARSFFAAFTAISDGTTDLNVESVHKEGIKGQGVKVLVLDDGLEIAHADLAANIDRTRTYNVVDGTTDPTPTEIDDAHGTNVAGIIAATQDGKGVMGVAPRVSLGGANYLNGQDKVVDAYGAADWSKGADVVNASFGSTPAAPLAYETPTSASTWSIRSFPRLRDGKGWNFVKAAGNSYEDAGGCAWPAQLEGAFPCFTPGNDVTNLETNVIVVAAGTAKGVKASYSSAGPVTWVTGLGGEYGNGGDFGETGSGPMIFSTDLTGCDKGYSRAASTQPKFTPPNQFALPGSAINSKHNAGCNYSSMNGTSAAAPTVTGVVALMLQANPKLTWRDVRDILRTTSTKIDSAYGEQASRNRQINLVTRTATSTSSPELVDGATSARLDLGWNTNAAGHSYSSWYGFGLVNAEAAVKAAKAYTAYKPAELNIPDFAQAFPIVSGMKYGQVQKLGTIAVTGSNTVDQFQVRLTGNLCIGAVGIFVKSPAGTISALSLPYNDFWKSGVSSAAFYGLASYAFYGEPAKGDWEIFAVNGVPHASCQAVNDPITPPATPVDTRVGVEYRIVAAK